MIKYILIPIFLLFVGCLPNPTNFDGKLSPKEVADKNLNWAIEAADRGYFEEARSYLEFIKKEYPYELEIQERVQIVYGDILVIQENYIDAIEVYQTFVKRYPESIFIPEAHFKTAECYYFEIPSDFFLLPPPYERDKDSIMQARDALMFFIGNFPQSPKIEKAKKMYTKVVDYLAEFEYYVGNFYYDHEKYQGAAWRFETLVSLYPNSSFEEDALFKIVLSYDNLKSSEKVNHFGKIYLSRFSTNSNAKTVKNLMKL
ncbi:outer membrane protein assembly factor BamD [bacterium]|nr:outer membrane protein assembly factor BamD [bacterium]